VHNPAGLVSVALDTPLRRSFDYLLPAGVPVPAPGSRAWVPLGRQRRVGLVTGTPGRTNVPRERLKPLLRLIDAEPVLDADTFGLLTWAAEYYHHAIGEVLFAALPAALREGAPARAMRERWVPTPAGSAAHEAAEPRRAPRQREVLAAVAGADAGGADAAMLDALGFDWRDALRALVRRGWVASIEEPDDAVPAVAVTPRSDPLPARRAAATPLSLEPEQDAAVAAVTASFGRYAAWLLHGITGSGKTEVYLQLVERVLARGERALLLVPEIGLTPQLIARFAERFDAPIAALHSALTGTERLAAWRAAASGHARIVIGTRSAVFAPVASLGLIVVDEEHDASFKQHDGGFRYSARDLAVVRAQRAGVPVVLGSATPSLESLHNAESGRYVRLALPRRAGTAAPPRLRLVDLRQEALRHGLSTTAAEAIRRHLAEDGQVLVFLNRRGYAPTLACTACGFIAPCRHCDARLTVYRAAERLRCHHCGAEAPMPARCPDCGYTVKPVGQGTERVEETLVTLFPDVPLARLDRDVARRNADVHAVVERVASGEARILVGTQMITKGHHFPEVTLAVVLNADQGLFSTDFRAAERLAQTIVQVAGRAGRGDRPGEVLIQTEYPAHPLLTSLLERGYDGFAATALAERRAAGWPPFSRLAALRASGRTLAEVMAFLDAARATAGRPHGVRLLGPAPAAMARRAGRFHAQLLAESADRTALHRFLSSWITAVEALPDARRVRFALDVDPLELF
jgi:primosomal protein N' (replication factor Y)